MLTKTLSLPKVGKKAKPRYPQKKTMNLMVREDNGNRISKALPLFLALVVFVGLFARFAVIGRLNALNAAQNQLDASKAQLSELNGSLADFAEVKEKFQRYSSGYLTEEELTLVDRLDLLDLLEEKLAGLAHLTSVSIVDNAITIRVTAEKLSDIAELRSALSDAEYVRSVTVFRADTVEDEEGLKEHVEASVVIEVGEPEEEAAP